jgi:hypothetical protein
VLTLQPYPEVEMIDQQVALGTADALPTPGASRQPGSAGKTPRRCVDRIDRLDEGQWDRWLMLALGALRDSGLMGPRKEEKH